MSNRERAAILALFEGLPAGRSERNHSTYTPAQIEGITRLREVRTPKEIETLLNISVYRVHKLVLAGRRARREAALRGSSPTTVGPSPAVDGTAASDDDTTVDDNASAEESYSGDRG